MRGRGESICLFSTAPLLHLSSDCRLIAWLGPARRTDGGWGTVINDHCMCAECWCYSHVTHCVTTLPPCCTNHVRDRELAARKWSQRDIRRPRYQFASAEAIEEQSENNPQIRHLFSPGALLYAPSTPHSPDPHAQRSHDRCSQTTFSISPGRGNVIEK